MMAMMMSSLYDALIEGGANHEIARKAAEEVAYDNKVARIESDLSLLKWMVGFNMTLTAGVLVKLLAAS